MRIDTVESPIFLKQIDERIPGFWKDLQPLMKATEQILATPVDTELGKAVQAQVAVASEHYGGVLAASANGFGLPAEAAARNLFDLVVGTIYLMKQPCLLADFIGFGKLTFYRLMKNIDLESSEGKQAQARDLAKHDAEIKRLEANFAKKRNSWHGRNVSDMAKHIGKNGEMEKLYKIVYKTASGIVHGSSYPIMNRNENEEWAIGFQRHKWDRYVKESPVLGYSMLCQLYLEVFPFLQIGDTTNLNEMEKVCARLTNG